MRDEIISLHRRAFKVRRRLGRVVHIMELMNAMEELSHYGEKVPVSMQLYADEEGNIILEALIGEFSVTKVEEEEVEEVDMNDNTPRSNVFG